MEVAKIRHYKWNREKLLHKKCESCDRENVSIVESGRGTKFLFNTATNEILKLAVGGDEI